ncbi:MAG: GTPase HflX [Candidatus Shikimatogenerans bostrichidophilus]|nr:MAG: GTPase HflX [Candidatus Shikimatogenerans bostrichidophilus]
MYKKNILIGLFKKNKNEAVEYLNELENLLKIFDGKVTKKFIQKKRNKNYLSYIGKGLLLKIIDYKNSNNIDTVIFDDELSLSQLKYLENLFKCNIIDRTKLILDIFAYKAKTFYSKIQVQLANLEYVLPRLKNMWGHLKRQKGGIGGRGPGEKEIETDKRLIRNKINILKNKLKKINKEILIQSNNRKGLISIAIVGYTNVGKTTIFNKITNNNYKTENKLFTTLDAKINNFNIKKKKILIIDTIGFLRKIPTKLIESFKSSIFEIKKSNLILHIIDLSSNFIFNKFLFITNFLFNELSIDDNKPIIIVFNKKDKIKNFNLLYLKKQIRIKILNNKYLIYQKKKFLFLSISTNNIKDILKLKNIISKAILI